MKSIRTECLVIGSGAGGAVTAAELAKAGREVLILEEGPRTDPGSMATNTPEAMGQLYRNGGLSPILGKSNMAFIEGCCVGGSTEINSAFWHRVPDSILEEWRSRFSISDLSETDLSPLFDELEEVLPVSALDTSGLPPSSTLFKEGADRMNWRAIEVKRAQSSDLTKSAYDAGAKRSMSVTYIPAALNAGAELLANHRVVRLRVEGNRITSVIARDKAGHEDVEISAEHVFLCAGAMQTPAILRASGIKRNIGNSLSLHPMLKVAAQFEQTVDGHLASLPAYQIKEFAPDISLGGAVFTPGFLALTLSDNWMQNEAAMRHWRHMALYYAQTRSKGAGSIRYVRPTGETLMRYRFAPEDAVLLTDGLRKLCQVLFAAGAKRVFPGIRSKAVFSGMAECEEFLSTPMPVKEMGLSVLHVFATCPMGEKKDRCAVDSFGRSHSYRNLHLHDASILPDSTGVNPQGTVMAVALRNVRNFLERGL